MGEDLISRKDAIDELSTPHGILYPIRTIEDLPSVQPERKKGRWLTDGGRQECSVCHTNFPDLYPLYDYASYCPNCGADMGGVQV